MARPIRDVGSAGFRESVAGARRRCGFEEAWQLSNLKYSSVLSSSVAIAFKWRGLAPWWHGLLRIVVRIAWPWCLVSWDAEPKPDEEAAQRCHDGCQSEEEWGA